jgi:hypothetical protein
VTDPAPFRLRRRTPEDAQAYLTGQLLRLGAENAALARVVDELTHPFKPGRSASRAREPRLYCARPDCLESADHPVHTTVDAIRGQLRQDQ